MPLILNLTTPEHFLPYKMPGIQSWISLGAVTQCTTVGMKLSLSCLESQAVFLAVSVEKDVVFLIDGSEGQERLSAAEGVRPESGGEPGRGTRPGACGVVAVQRQDQARVLPEFLHGPAGVVGAIRGLALLGASPQHEGRPGVRPEEHPGGLRRGRIEEGVPSS